MEWAIVVSGAISAVAWLGSAVITPDLSKSYYGGPPPKIRRRVQIGSALNGTGALFAAIAIGCQAWITYLSIGAAT